MLSLSQIKEALFGKPLDDNCIEARRRFLKGAAGVAAVAVIAGAGGFRLLSETEQDRLVAAIASGLVEDQTFILDRTAVIECQNVTFRRCSFIAAPGFVGDYIVEFGANSKINLIESCCFQGKDAPTLRAAIRFTA